MARSPSVTLSFTEGLQDNFAYLFCNDKAEIPVKVSVKSGGAVIEEVGLYNASKRAEALCAPGRETDLSDRVVVRQIADVSDRAYQAHPSNKEQSATHVGDYDDARTFLVRTCNKGGLKGDKARQDTLMIGAYAKLSGYVTNSSHPTQTIYAFSYMRALDVGKRALVGATRLALKLAFMPEISLFVRKLPLSNWRVHGSGFNHGSIYSIRASYGPYAGSHKPVVKTVTNKVYEKSTTTGEYVERKPSAKQFGMSPDDDEDGVTTFYCDSPEGHSDVILRGILHGTKERGLISQKLNGEVAQYRFEKGDAAVTFSVYYKRSKTIPQDKAKQLKNTKIAMGMFTTTVEDVYGSTTTAAVQCHTSYQGNEPVTLRILHNYKA